MVQGAAAILRLRFDLLAPSGPALETDVGDSREVRESFQRGFGDDGGPKLATLLAKGASCGKHN